MKKLLLVTTGVLFFFCSNAQADSLKWVTEINEQVWKPFIAHFISGNKEGFRAVHSKKITRVEIDRGIVMDFDKYFPPVTAGGKQPSKTYQRQFELRFDKRISNGSRGWESGYYKGTMIQEGKEPKSYYGRFYVVLEKENDGWKIIVDADSGKEASEEKFNKAAAM